MSERTYAAALTALIAMLLALVLAINFVIDPYRLRLPGSASDATVRRPDLHAYVRLTKPYVVARGGADAVVFGSSQAQMAFVPEPLERRGFRHPWNLALPGTFINEVLVTLQCALEHARPRLAILSLNFTSFNLRANRLGPPFQCDSSLERAVRLHASVGALAASWSALAATHADSDRRTLAARQLVDADGFSPAELFFGPRLKTLGHRGLFQEEEDRYMAVEYTIPFIMEETGGRSHFSDFRSLVRLALSSGIELKVFVIPEHVRQLELVRAAGLWPAYEAWKRELVRVIEEENRGAAKPAELWDFSGYDPISTEAVPATGDRSSRMRYFLDVSHYTPRVGELILARMLDGDEGRQHVPSWFGERLTSANLDERLARIRHDRESWRDMHPEELRELERRMALKQERVAIRFAPGFSGPVK